MAVSLTTEQQLALIALFNWARALHGNRDEPAHERAGFELALWDAVTRCEAAFRDSAENAPVAAEPKVEQSDERPRVVQHQYIREDEYTHAAEIILLEDGSVWGRKRRGDGGWERQPLPAAARGGPR